VNPIRAIKNITEGEVLQLVSGEIRQKIEYKFSLWINQQKDANI
jgi:hypothetical protein